MRKFSFAIVSALLMTILNCTAQKADEGIPEVVSDRLLPGEHDVLIDGLSFHYVVRGRGALLVVQAPGWGIGSAYLRNGLAPLEKQFTVLTFDPRGSGSSAPMTDYKRLSNADMVDDLERLRLYWGVKAFKLMGHSNGGAIAIGYAERYPARVDRLMVVGSELGGFSAKDAVAKENAWRRQDARFTSALEALHEGSESKTDEGFTRNFVASAGYYLYRPQKDLPVFISTLSGSLTVAATAVYSSSPMKNSMPPLAALGDVTAPVLVLVGLHDPTCPVKVSIRIHEGIPASQLIVYEETGHFPWIEQPGRFFADALKFFTQGAF